MSGEKYSVRRLNDNELELEIKGESHTLGNILVRSLSRMKDVEEAYYNVEHPLKETIIIYVRTKGSLKPVDALKQAVDESLLNLEEIERSLKKALEKK